MAVEAWYMDSSEEDQRKPLRPKPNEPVSLDEQEELGVFYWKLSERHGHVTAAFTTEKKKKTPINPFLDISIHKDTLPNYEEKLKMFFGEHLDDEILYILDGHAYLDVRGEEERWIRIAMTKGDLITLLAGIYHRFTLDETNYTKAMRRFVGEPAWKAYNRPADDFEPPVSEPKALPSSW